MSFDNQVLNTINPVTNDISNAVRQGIGQFGRMGLNALYPNEFEYYLIALELYEITDQGILGSKIDTLIFPINPSNLSEPLDFKINVKKTTLGTIVLGNNTFKSNIISLSGSFGKRWKLMLNKSETSYKDRFGNQPKFFSIGFHSGYGFTKKLENMCWKATQKQTNGFPYQLIYTNLSWNTAYYVEPKAFVPTMSLANNMMWQYQLSLTTTKEYTIDSKNKNKAIVNKILSDTITKLGPELATSLQNIILP